MCVLVVVAAAASAPANLSAPVLARTSSTVLLLWDRPEGAVAGGVFQILRNGEPVGETAQLSFTATGLAAGRTHRFAVRHCDAAGRWSAATAPIEAATKPAAPIVDVRSRGARGDGVAKDTAAIQAAIADCPPGGTVLIPPGTYSVDHLELKGDLTLELAAGATLQFLPRGVGNYPTRRIALPGPTGEVSVEHFGLITAHRVKNLTITGGGVINGNGPSWWPHTSQPRPRLLRFTDCQDIFVQGITLDDSPAWNTHAVYVDRAVFSQVKFRKVSAAHGTNGDGLNPDSARDVLIVGCTFANQDDSIAIKAPGVSATRPRPQRSCENIVIRDCLVDGTLVPGTRPLGFAVGSECGGGVRRVLVRDCVFRDAASLINIKANRQRPGAVVEDVRVERCTYVNRSVPERPYNRAPLTIDLFYYRDFGTPDTAAPLTAATPVFRDLHFKDITIENPKGRFAYVAGFIERPVCEVTFESVTGSARTGFHGQNLDGVTLRHVAVTAREGPPFTWINVINHRGLAADAFPNPSSVSSQPIP